MTLKLSAKTVGHNSAVVHNTMLILLQGTFVAPRVKARYQSLVLIGKTCL